MFAKVLTAACGAAAGFALAIVLTITTERPRKLIETEKQKAAQAEQRAAGAEAKLSEAAAALARSDAALNAAIDQKADTEAELVAAEETARERTIEAEALRALLNLAEDLPRFGQFSAFQAQVNLTGSFTGSEESLADAKKSLTAQLADVGIPLVEKADGKESALLIVLVQTANDNGYAASISIAVAGRLANGEIVFLHSSNGVLAGKEINSFSVDTVMGVRSLAKEFKQAWQSKRTEFLAAKE